MRSVVNMYAGSMGCECGVDKTIDKLAVEWMVYGSVCLDLHTVQYVSFLYFFLSSVK